MKHDVIIAKRRPTNVTLPDELVREARALNVSMSKACEVGLAAAVRAERNRRWQVEHRDRVDAFAVWFEEHGLPFQDIRVF